MDDVFGIGKVVEKLADPLADLIKRVAGPAADEIGLTLQDRVRVYRARRSYQLLEKLQRFCRKSGIDARPISLKLLLPALDYASVEDDEDIHTMWANLLTNAADPSQDEVLPSFADTLKQLSKPEAVFLNAFYDKTLEWQRSAGAAEPFTVAKEELLNVCPQMPDLTVSFDHFVLIVDDLRRLGLLRVDTKVLVPDEMLEIGGTPAHLQHAYFISEYAMSFVKACRAPTTKSG